MHNRSEMHIPITMILSVCKTGAKFDPLIHDGKEHTFLCARIYVDGIVVLHPLSLVIILNRFCVQCRFACLDRIEIRCCCKCIYRSGRIKCYEIPTSDIVRSHLRRILGFKFDDRSEHNKCTIIRVTKTSLRAIQRLRTLCLNTIIP